MKIIKWWKKNETNEDFQGLELKLQTTLIPVIPRPEFIAGLRKSLLKQVPEINLTLEPQSQKLQTGLLITGGVLGAMAMVLTGIRGLVSVVGVIGLLLSIIKQYSQDAPMPSS